MQMYYVVHTYVCIYIYYRECARKPDGAYDFEVVIDTKNICKNIRNFHIIIHSEFNSTYYVSSYCICRLIGYYKVQQEHIKFKLQCTYSVQAHTSHRLE